MKGRFKLFFLWLLLGGLGITALTGVNPNFSPEGKNPAPLKLPEPRYSGVITLEEALLNRRSIRSYQDEPLSLEQISQLLWAAQGITDYSRGFRTAPSAGATYPLDVYFLSGKVIGLPAGLYHYLPERHELILVEEGDKRQELFQASLRQTSIREAAGVLIFTAIYKRTTARYGERGFRYVHMETGHAAQNVYLQAVSLGLGTVTIGAFEDKRVKKVLNLAEEEEPLYLMPVGII